ncbi:MAG: porin family protein [Alistipes sp.]
MKKICLCVLGIVVMSLCASAQNKSTWGVRAGLNISDMTQKQDGESGSTGSRASFHVGVAYQFPIVKKLPLYIETGLYLSGRGAKVNEETVNVKMNMLYMQVPVLVSWHFNLNSVSLQPYVGAFYGLGVHGKLKAGDREASLFKANTIEGVEIPQAFKRSEVGLRFGLGVAIKKHYYVGVGYDLGLTNILKNESAIGVDKGAKMKNGSFFVSLGYNF